MVRLGQRTRASFKEKVRLMELSCPSKLVCKYGYASRNSQVSILLCRGVATAAFRLMGSDLANLIKRSNFQVVV